MLTKSETLTAADFYILQLFFPFSFFSFLSLPPDRVIYRVCPSNAILGGFPIDAEIVTSNFSRFTEEEGRKEGGGGN